MTEPEPDDLEVAGVAAAANEDGMVELRVYMSDDAENYAITLDPVSARHLGDALFRAGCDADSRTVR